MKFIFGIIGSLLLSTSGFAQRTMNNDEILRAVIDNNSPYYYPSLETRYMAGDTTLTVNDYFYLYYGFAHQDAYKPLEGNTAADKLLNILAANPEPTPEEALKIVEQAQEAMKRDPFSLKNINFLIYAYGILGDTVNEKINYDRLTKIIAAIKSSGTGTTVESPWHVLSFSHSSDLLAAMELQAMKRMIVSRTVEYIPLLSRNGNIKGYYFDFGRAYWRKPDNLPEKRSAGLEINGIKPKKKK